MSFVHVVASDLGPALERALASNRSSLVTLPVDYREHTILSARLGKIACPI